MSDLKPRSSGLSADEKQEVFSDAYHTVLEALEAASRAAAAKGLSRADIARRASISPSRVTKVLNGDASNITLKTMFLMMKAMNRKIFIKSVDYGDLAAQRTNVHFDMFRQPLESSKATIHYNKIDSVLPR